MKVNLDNGWAVSIIDDGYGSDRGLMELAVIAPDGRLHYKNPVTPGDVRGYLTEPQVDDLIHQVALFSPVQMDVENDYRREFADD